MPISSTYRTLLCSHVAAPAARLRRDHCLLWTRLTTAAAGRRCSVHLQLEDVAGGSSLLDSPGLSNSGWTACKSGGADLLDARYFSGRSVTLVRLYSQTPPQHPDSSVNRHRPDTAGPRQCRHRARHSDTAGLKMSPMLCSGTRAASATWQRKDVRDFEEPFNKVGQNKKNVGEKNHRRETLKWKRREQRAKK